MGSPKQGAKTRVRGGVHGNRTFHVTWKKIDVYYLQDLETTQRTWGHTARSLVERERERKGRRSQAWVLLRVRV